ncbi:MOSC domain-containing protein [Desulfovibrio subterraneus]|jgi:MOSC domain-containing protein YiiM|uniref:Molybdenum cofactor sulfurase n=1 Tax=Desulfovibrio subterraneus TaxID=2718620 RepID=A0A7J0BGG1_9BACT|nr:MOSC domain-containing protein [Desulfovibrio subterraneus]WBF67058.1 MOSC domain-containing protein [Desulfovibrio subterraneus]GFM32790.1 molybdenum cofactor sulfurase [Desulfovibrio subterraneus]
MNGTIVAVCTSTRTGEKKVPVQSVTLEKDFGIVGDVHGGTGRQVSLLAVESVDPMREKMPSLSDGDFAENLLVRGIPLARLLVGTKLRAGDGVEMEITQIGKKCHSKCNIHKTVGYCIMPTEGVFVRILSGGTLKPGDSIAVV